MKDKLLIILAIFLGMAICNAQKNEFLKVPPLKDDDVTKAKSLIDGSAPAEILYRSIHFRLDYNTGTLVKTYNYRIKVYNKDKADDWLNLEIPLYENGNRRETLDKIRATTYNYENGKVVGQKVENSSQYKSKENKNVSIKKFAFPAVKNGSVLEYNYIVNSPFIYAIPQIFVDLDIPTVYSEYVLEHPQNISYNINYTGSLMPKHRIVKEDVLYGVNSKTFRFGYENLRGFQKEKFVKNSNNFRTKISAEVNSTYTENQGRDGYRPEVGGLTKYSTSWENIKDRLLADEDFGGELKKTKFVKEQLPASISELKDDMAKADEIFKLVQKNYNWNNERGIYTDKGFKNLVATKLGNAAEINLFLIAMMREAGLDANPLLISTVDNGMLNIAVPKVTDLNFVIAAVKSGGQYLLYDATSKQSSRDDLPPNDWNEYGIYMSKAKALQLQIFNNTMSHNNLQIVAKINNDGTVSGSYNDTDTGAFAMNAKKKYDEDAEKYKKQYKENFSTDFSNINSKVLDNGHFQSDMTFASNNLMDVVGKKIIVNPLLFLVHNSNAFDQTEPRQFPVEFISPITRTKKVVLGIPEGYEVESMPKSSKIKTQDNEIEYSYIVEKNGKNIEVTSTTKIASSNYPKEYYAAFKQVWEKILKSENQVINLVKK